MNLGDLGPRELALLRLYANCQLGMSPRDFYAKWNVTHAQMAQICGCSEPTVDRWFAGPSSYRQPEPIYLRRLAEMNLLWEFYEQIPAALKQWLCPPPHSNEQELSS
ncbi:helix-turn-helix domain-containing protein [Leptolyngbya sp. FACHB-541]|uniref:helix-turn-helix domain-containing protein n=1 Tax=Leptolyngbya sp. FACHB-541 TaxID=2692810 RepID=UPI0016836889|nr:helix-turn-helix domain-containing protein [Leptolyngbya sp. FACHB-541]MBD2001421.1 helix-turn-helix domain-containing protein [Leptolyngbya sp. FACHB-541]